MTRDHHILSVIGEKQGRIHGNPVAEGWAGSVMRTLEIQNVTDRPTERHGEVYSRVSATKNDIRGQG